MKLSIKISILFVLVFCFRQTVQAQLITDSDRKLKTEKSDAKGFLFFNSKKKTPKSSAPAGQQSYSFTEARFSPKSPFIAKNKPEKSRFKSADRNSLFRHKNVNPRYSSEKQRPYRLASGPRYSPGSPFTKRDVLVNPRYSSGSPFKSKNFVVIPRYSDERRWSKRDLALRTPRYSPGSPWTKWQKVVSPRYSTKTTWNKWQQNVMPRYSNGNVWSKNDIATRAPRYSPGSPWSKFDKTVDVRYSPGNPFDNIKWIVKPDYSTNKHRFVVNKRMKKEDAIFDFESSRWKGVRPGRFNKDQSMHPSAAYTNSLAFNLESEDMLRKLNVFWSRLDGNKVQPPSVKDKVKKPKFDRKETEIWNN